MSLVRFSAEQKLTLVLQHERLSKLSESGRATSILRMSKRW
jgi:hypothetical protein